MNGWVFFNNLMFGFLTGLTMGFVQSSHYTDTDQPAYITAWHAGNVAGWATIISIAVYLFQIGVFK